MILFNVGHGLWTSFASGFSLLGDAFKSYANDANNMKIAAVILLLSAFVLFLFLIIILYVKAMLTFLQGAENKQIEDKNEKKARRLEMEEEMEKELERELEKAHIQKMNTEQEEFIAKQKLIEQEETLAKEREEEKRKQDAAQKESLMQAQEKELQEIKMREDEEKLIRETILAQEEKEKTQQKEQELVVQQKAKKNTSTLDFDWKKGQSQKNENGAEILKGISLQYQQQKKNLQDLIGLALNMISRNIDENKIAQTLKYRSQKDSGEDNILQLIESLKGFVDMCVEGKFASFADGKEFPTVDEALYNLAHGDITPCGQLLEKLLNENIEKSSRVRLDQKREDLMLETSREACLLGSLSSITDVMMATTCFEMAIELYPKNINAWNKLGDMYMKAGAFDKGVWAYNNLLNMSDDTLYARQVANANKALSDYYYANGDSIAAAKMYNESKRYYDSIGINNDLSSRESDIIGIIESKQEENLHSIVAQLLHRDEKQY